jgi:hypothetical protein
VTAPSGGRGIIRAVPQHTDPVSVCERGHVIHLSPDPEVHHCPDCGASNSFRVPSVRKADSRSQPRLAVPVHPPDFCSNCGAPYPWVGRKGRIYEMENLLAEQKLDPAIELAVS